MVKKSIDLTLGLLVLLVLMTTGPYGLTPVGVALWSGMMWIIVALIKQDLRNWIKKSTS